jgi:hypothetical protein
MTEASRPRIYCIPATEAPVVAVFRRGPSRWAHVGRWDLESRKYEAGAWLSGRIFPRRSDLSPDGRLLCYFAHKPGASWEHGEAYVALSRLPWLTALHAFATCGTWTRGYYGVDQAVDGLRVIYSLEREGRLEMLDDLQWADWDREGRLLAATRSGRIQIHALAGARSDVLFDEDLSRLEPKSQTGSDWAGSW